MTDAVDHDLGRVNGAVASGTCVGALAGRMARGTVRILPTQAVPIVDGEREDGEASLQRQVFNEGISRGARRASLAREQFDHAGNRTIRSRR